MDAEFGKLAGIIVILAIFGAPALASFAHASKSGPRSLRLANFALGCGFALLILPEMWLVSENWEHTSLVMWITGSLRILISLTGIVLALLAAVRGGEPGGAGVARPVWAILLCVLHLLVAGIVLLYAWKTGDTSWVYQSPDGMFRVKLPTKHWQQGATKELEKEMVFVRQFPSMRASIKVLRPQTQQDHTKVVDSFLMQVARRPPGPFPLSAEFRDGKNASGWTYNYCTLWENDPNGKPIFVARAFWWCPDKQAVIIIQVEGHPSTHQVQERDLFFRSAETICLSLE